jgi:ABC-type transport system substrate-binding protein
MANMLGRVGVKVEVRPYEWGVFYADVKKSNFEIFTMQMTELAVPDYHYHFFHSGSIPGANLLAVNLRQARWLLAHIGQMESGLAALAGRRLVYLVTELIPGLLLRASLGFPARASGGGNRFIYRNTEVDWLLDAARMVTDRETQKQLYGRVQAILHRELPFIPLWHEHNLAVTGCRVRGYELLPNARFSSLIETWKAKSCQ